jgi:uncharacterized protein YyaL (SSP411 family)
LLAESPFGWSTLLAALADLQSPPTIVLIDGAADDALSWQRALEARYRPSVRIVNVAGIAQLPPALAKGPRPPKGAVAWVCRGRHCLPAITTLAELQREVASSVADSVYAHRNE